MAGSIGTVGDALDNALCESTIGLFKTEATNDGGPVWADRRAVEWQGRPLGPRVQPPAAPLLTRRHPAS